MSTPSTDPAFDVPWGRPPLAEIPVPPFASLDEHLLFLRCLAVHLAASVPGSLQRTDGWNATVEQVRRQAGEVAR